MSEHTWVPTKSVTRMHEAFLRLLHQKNYSDISIKDITDEADVNRRTFYLHYEDKHQLFEEIMLNFIELKLKPFVDPSFTAEEKAAYAANGISLYYAQSLQFAHVILENLETAQILFSDSVPPIQLSTLKTVFHRQNCQPCDDTSFYLFQFDDRLSQDFYADLICIHCLEVIRFIIANPDHSVEELATQIRYIYKIIGEIYSI